MKMGLTMHIERAKPHALDNACYQGLAPFLEAQIWYQQRGFKDVASEALHAQQIFEKLVGSRVLETYKALPGKCTRNSPSLRRIKLQCSASGNDSVSYAH